MRLIRSLLAALFVVAAFPQTGSAVGTIFGLPLSQQLGEDGKPLSGAKLYVYAANTSNPSTIYSDFALSVEATWPLEADAQGRLPEFWLADGAYRVRLTTAGGVGVFDLQSITALGPSSGAGGGGGVSDAQIFQTGDLLFKLVGGTRSGWVRGNGRTIGSAASGATERANADTQTLFEYLWNNCSACTVSSGRGANAAADFAANKTIVVWDMRGRTAYGTDTMGNSAASVLPGVDTEATFVGAATQTIAQENLPSYNLSISSLSITGDPDLNGSQSGGLTRNFSKGSTTRSLGSGANYSNLEPGDVSFSDTTLSVDRGNLDVGGSLSSGGSDTALPTLSPGVTGTWYIKL